MKRKILILSKNAVNIGNISFDNPIWVASGTFGYGTETPELVDVEKLGGHCNKIYNSSSTRRKSPSKNSRNCLWYDKFNWTSKYRS